MKTTFLISILFLTTLVHSAKLDVRISIKNAITNAPIIESVEVIMFSEEGEQLAQGKSNEKGIFETSIEMPKKSNELRIKCLPSNDIYAEKSIFLFIGKVQTFTFEIKLGPSEKMYANWYAEDDGIYGGDKEGVLTPEFNSDNLICGCALSEFKEAQFVGGQESMFKYVNTVLVFPQESIEMNEQGRVYLKFIIEEDGKITHIKIERGSSPTLDAEAYRVMRSMPNWESAECNGKKVRSVGRLPFSFTLN